MSIISTTVTAELRHALDAAAAQLNRSRAEVVRLALEQFLLDWEDGELAQERANDPSDPVLDWEDVKRALSATA